MTGEAEVSGSPLTLIIPTHNRASQCAALLQFLRSNDVASPVCG